MSLLNEYRKIKYKVSPKRFPFIPSKHILYNFKKYSADENVKKGYEYNHSYLETYHQLDSLWKVHRKQKYDWVSTLSSARELAREKAVKKELAVIE
jgi:hypothetical protein